MCVCVCGRIYFFICFSGLRYYSNLITNTRFGNNIKFKI